MILPLRFLGCFALIGTLVLPSSGVIERVALAAETATALAMPMEEPSAESDYQMPLDQEPISVSEAQYEAVFKKPASPWTDSRSGVSLKSVRVEWDEYDEFFSYVKLEVAVPAIPGYFRLVGPNEFHRHSQVIVNNVKDRKGKNIFDAKSSFEEAPFTYLNYDYTDSYMDLFAAERTVHVKKGTKEGVVASVDGKVRFDLPVEVKPIEFKVTELGKKKTYGASSVTLKKVEENDMTISYQGPTENFIKMIGYDAQGNILRWLEKTGTFPDARKKPIDIHVAFDGEVKTVKVFVAKKTLVKQFPFVLKAPKK